MRTRAFGLTIALAWSAATLLPASPLAAAPRLLLDRGWEICAPEQAAGPSHRSVCEQSAKGPHWTAVDPDRERQLYFRIDEATDRWLQIDLPAMPDCAEPAVYFGVVNLSFVAYLDGDEIYRFGEPELGPAGFAGRPFHLISLPGNPPRQIEAERPRRLSLRIWSDFRNIGIDGGPPVLGCRADLQQQIVREDVARLLIGGFAILVGLAGFALFARARRETVYLAFGLLGCNVSLYVTGNRSMRLPQMLIEDPLLWYNIEHYSLYFLPAALAYFFQELADQSRPARFLTGLLTLLAIGFTICSLFFLPPYKTYGLFLYTILGHGLFFIYVVPHAMYKGPQELRILVACVVVFFGLGLLDVLWALGYMTWWPGPISPYGFFLLLIGMSITIWRRYVRIQDDLRAAHEALRVYAQHLESLVEQRTSELQFSLDEVSRLKEQQDGDYLLISRILHPMTSTTIGEEVIRVDSIVAQHKRFEFRGMGGELGGDLCMAEPLQLDGERYVAFMNADAMGKSVQGASGAIVLAVAFRAFLHLSADGQIPISGRPPVEWLLRLTEELQRVFRPFEGRMMVSLLLGLVHEKSGQLYAINAGHPSAVLLRAGAADYVLEHSHDPIGSAIYNDPDFDFQFGAGASSPPRNSGGDLNQNPPIAYAPDSAIVEMQLQPGDVLIAGSDGRDDLRRKDDDGRDLIQSDPERFARIVQSSAGDLQRIRESLNNAGEQTDDLSLLRLSYRE